MPHAHTRNPRPGHDPLHPARGQDTRRAAHRRNPAPGRDPFSTRPATTNPRPVLTNPKPGRDPLHPAAGG
jgi:hypothetical protein